MSPHSPRAFLIAALLGLMGWGLWMQARESTSEVAAGLRETTDVAPESAIEGTHALPSSGAGIKREVVDPQEAFIARWRDLYSDPERRQRIRGPRMKMLEEMRRTLAPLPYEQELQRLAAAGVVPAPPKEAFEDLLFEEMDHARNMLQNQVESFSLHPASKVQHWRDRENQFVYSHSLYFAPESLAAYFLGRDVTSEASRSDELMSRLAEARARSLRAYAQAWVEYQYVGFCSFSAGLETGFTLSPGQQVEETAKIIPEARAAVDRVIASHADYLRDVRDALIIAFPGEVF